MSASSSTISRVGTCLARAHRLVRRMSEDVDFKVAPLDGEPVSTSKPEGPLMRNHSQTARVCNAVYDRTEGQPAGATGPRVK